ncbi:MAG: hypothetical protein JW808_10210 [Victivallales bacterium]|nr:hypothetical protein [Victivallales bacterium]
MMVKLFSFRMWLDLSGMILKSLYPAEIVLVLFSPLGFSKLRASRVFRWLLIFLVCDLGVKLLVFFAGVRFSSRYFLVFSLVVTFFCAAGMLPLAELLREICLKVGLRLPVRTYVVLILLTIGLSYAGKGLNPRTDKVWISAVADVVSTVGASGDVPVLISTSDEERIGFYAGTEDFFIFKPEGKWRLLKRKQHKEVTKWMPCSVGVESFDDYISSLGPRRIFFVLHSKDTDIVRGAAFLCESFPGMRRVETLDFGKRQGVFEILLLDTRGNLK